MAGMDLMEVTTYWMNLTGANQEGMPRELTLTFTYDQLYEAYENKSQNWKEWSYGDL